MSRTAYAASLYDKVIARYATLTKSEHPFTKAELDLIWIAIRLAVEIEDEERRRTDD